MNNISATMKKFNWKFFRESHNGATVSIFIAFIVISIVFAILSPVYLTINNFLNIGLYAAIIGVMGAGVTPAMLMAGLDLSQHAVAALSTVLTSIFVITWGIPLGWSLAMVFVAGIICGLFNGLLIAVFGISPMIATMGSQYIIRGLCYILTQAKTILFTNPALEFIGRGNILGIPNSIIIMLLVFLILSYVLNKTRFGRSVYAVGSNEKASYLSGISPVKVKLVAYVIAAVSSTLGGIITVSQVGAAVPSSGVGSEMEIIAAVYLGGVAAMGGKGNLIGTFLGVLVICCINNGLTLIGVQSYWQTFMRGVVILAAIYMDTLRTQRSKAA
jgi:ribose transport system permease protein